MKKFLSLVLALVMTMSLVTVSAGAKDFTDSDKITYEEAVAVMSEVGVIDGYTTGDFRPTATLTRGAAAKIICNLILGPTTAGALVADAAPYSDVATDNVFAGYIAYCQKTGIISGYADGTFRPGNSLTGYAFMKMLLGALGYKAEVEGYTGDNWSINVAKQAINAGLNAGLVEEFNGTKAVTREEACLYAFNTLKANMVDYDTTITIGGVTVAGARFDVANGAAIETIKNDNKMQFAERYFSKLTKKTNVTDDFGRPAVTWINNKAEIGTFVDYTTLAAAYTTEVKGGEVYSDIGSAAAKFDDVTYYVDGKQVKDVSSLTAVLKKGNDKTFGASDDGVLTEVYVDTDAESIVVVMVNTYIAEVTADYNSKKEYLSVEYASAGYGTASGITGAKVYLDDVAGIEDYEDGDMILVQIADGVIVNVIDPEVVEDTAISKWSKGSYLVAASEQYDFNANLRDYSGNFETYKDKDALEDKTYDVYVDQYGYAIGIKQVTGSDKFLFLAGYDKAQSNLTRKTAEAYVIFVDGTDADIKIDFNESNALLGNDKLNDKGDANRNTWFKYTEDDGVYTLTKVANQIVVAYGDGTYAKKTINCENARVTDGTDTAWGNDDSAYITVEYDAVDTDKDPARYDTLKQGISKVTGTYTGVQDVDLVLDAASPFKKVANNQAAATGDVIYALFGSDNYIDAAIVIGEENAESSKAYAYALKGAKSESFKDGYYYWEFEAAVAGIVDTLTIKTKYKEVINTVASAIVDADVESTYGVKGLLKLTYDKDGYVTGAELMNADKADDKIYSAADRKAGKDLDPADFNAYQIFYAEGKKNETDLTCSGRTLYARDSDVGLTLVSGAPVVVIQLVEDEDKEVSRTIDEYTTIASALNSLAGEGKSFVGTVAAKLNDKGTAEWIVISSATVVPYEKKTSTSDTAAKAVKSVKWDNGWVNVYDKDGTHVDTEVEVTLYQLRDNGYVEVGTYAVTKYRDLNSVMKSGETYKVTCGAYSDVCVK